MRIALCLAVIWVSSAAKLSTIMSANTFIQNADTPTAAGSFVVWNNQAWHFGDDGIFRMWQHSTRAWKDLSNSVYGKIPTARLSTNFVIDYFSMAVLTLIILIFRLRITFIRSTQLNPLLGVSWTIHSAKSFLMHVYMVGSLAVGPSFICLVV